jgi:signal peptidase
VTTNRSDMTVRSERPTGTRRSHGVRRVANIVAASTLAVALTVVVLVVAGMVLGAWRIVPVRSGSMTPAAPKGSAVFAQPTRTAALHVGDVVLFRAPTGSHPLVVHRIHEIVVHNGERLYRTKGDANAAPDPWLIRMRSTTVWRVRHVIPMVGSAVDEMAKPGPRFAGIVLASLVILGVGLSRIWRREDAEADTATEDATGEAAPAEPALAEAALAEAAGADKTRIATAAIAAQAATTATASAAAAARSVDDATGDGADEVLHSA